MVERLIASLKEEPELYLLFEVLHYLIHLEEGELFQFTYPQAIEGIETEEALRELLILTAEYFNANEKEKEEALVNDLLENQKGKDLQEAVPEESEALLILRDLVTLSPA